MERLVIDRFEGDFAVCEKDDRTIVDIPIKDIPSECNEGSVINVYDGGYIEYDSAETESRARNIDEVFSRLLKKQQR